MANSETIKEFLVSVAFDVDKNSEKRADNSVKSFTKGLEKLAKVAAAAGVATFVIKTAAALEKLYYQSQRIKASTANIKAFEGAVQSLGGSAEEALGSMESMAKNLRNGPGFYGMLEDIGVKTKDVNGKIRDQVDLMSDLGKKFADMPHYQANSYANALGIDEKTMMAMKDGRFVENLRKYSNIRKQMGLSNNDAKVGQEFTQQLRETSMIVGIVLEKLAVTVMKVLLPPIKFVNNQFEKLLEWFNSLPEGAKETIKALIKVVLILTSFQAILALALPAVKGLTIAIRLLNLSFLMSPIGIVLALAAAIALLWEDYKVWKEGGQSLIDWEKWEPGINAAVGGINSLKNAILDLGKAIYNHIENVAPNAADWIGESTAKVAAFFGNQTAIDALEANKLVIPPLNSGKPNVVSNNEIQNKDADSNEMQKFKQDIDPKIAKAAQDIRKNAEAKSIGRCGKYVNDAIRKQGINSTGHGKDVAENLINSKQGFRQVKYDKNYKPQIGDVMSLPAGKGQHVDYGHVAMWDGKNWVSDFVQPVTRGNTPATSDTSFRNIQRGVSVPTIARRGGVSNKTTLNKNAAGKSKAQQAVDYFKSKGWTRKQAIGIVANLQQESGSNLNHKAIGDSGKAFGIAQWHPDRQANFKRIFKKDIKDSTFEEQLDFIEWELRNTHKKAGNKLKGAKNINEATKIFKEDYEAPKDKYGTETPARQKLAQRLESKIAVLNTVSRNSNMVAGLSPALVPNVANSTNINVSPVTNITVNGVSNPREAATIATNRVDDSYSQLTRSLQVTYS